MIYCQVAGKVTSSNQNTPVEATYSEAMLPVTQLRPRPCKLSKKRAAKRSMALKPLGHEIGIVCNLRNTIHERRIQGH